MKKLFIRLLALVSLWLVAECISANPITETEALKRANQFMPDKHFSARKYSPRYASSQATPPFYIFNADDGGFVLVSGDDRTTPILGYSKHGQLDLSQAPENLLYWLDCYAQQIESLDHGCSAVTNGASLSDAAAISPLIQTKWSQNDPYNAQCPYGPNSDERCLTGCVATCMAQIMYYYKWPEHCPAIPAYTPKGFSQPLDELPPVDFRWDDMQLTYGRNEEGLAADAVAQLMRYCGQSVEMNYGLKVSTAALSTQIMIEPFDYSENTKVIWRKNYNEADWESIIYQELAKGHPVPYSGSSIESGHQFICDGYNNGYYHINWGWGGYLDSYFVLSVANPYTDGRSGYSREQYAIIGLESRSVLSDYEVKSFTFSEDVNLNEETKVEILLTNQGNTSRERLFLWIKQEDEWSMTVAATGTVAAGQTGEVVMTFVPTTEGVFDVKLTSDPEGEVVKATATIHVVEPVEKAVGNLVYICNSASRHAIVKGAKEGASINTCVIPETFDADGVTYSVVGIANDAFNSCYDIALVTLPSTLKFIGEDAFWNCYRIKELIIPEECETIGSSAFAYCFGIEKLVLPAKSISLGDNAFKNISNLVSVISHCNSPCSISVSVFSYSTWNEEKQNYDYEPSPATLYVPVGSKADYIAKGWDQFLKISEGEPEEIVIGDLRYQLLTTEKTAIVLPDDSYKELTEVKIPERVEYEGVACSVVGIANDAFSRCYDITFVTLPSTLMFIGKNAFYYCNNIKEINIPEECETIGSYAFAYCYRLQKLVLPAKLSSLGDNAFSDISTLVSVVSPCKSPCSISDNVFSRSKWNAEKQDYDYEPSSATLYVPVGCKTDYIAKGWDQFAAIVEDDESGIDIVIDNGRQNDDGMLYNLYGQRVTNPQTGIFIQNGKKILIR